MFPIHDGTSVRRYDGTTVRRFDGTTVVIFYFCRGRRNGKLAKLRHHLSCSTKVSSEWSHQDIIWVVSSRHHLSCFTKASSEWSHHGITWVVPSSARNFWLESLPRYLRYNFFRENPSQGVSRDMIRYAKWKVMVGILDIPNDVMVCYFILNVW